MSHQIFKAFENYGSGIRNFTIEGKIGICKMLVTSWLYYLAPLIKITKCIIQVIEKIQKLAICENILQKSRKLSLSITKMIKQQWHSLENDGLNNSDIHLKMMD